MPRTIVILIGLLLTIGYTARPALAQQTNDPPKITDVIDETLEKLRRVETEQRARADAWAQRRRVPVSVRQADGRRVLLVGLEADRPVYLTSLNRIAALTTRTATLHPGNLLGLNLTGQGMDIGIWDAGLPLQSHQELLHRVTTRDLADYDDHATHVAGTLVASGVRSDARCLRHAEWWSQTASMRPTESTASVTLLQLCNGLARTLHETARGH